MKRDFEKYLVQLQKQYNEMNKSVEEANRQIREGMITESQVETLKNMVVTITNNYNRVLYCRYLYNLPPKFIQKLMNKKLQKQLKKFQDEHADEDTVLKENEEALNESKEVIGNGESGEVSSES